MTKVLTDSFLLALKENGFALMDNLFSDQVLSDLTTYIQTSKEDFKKSGVGRESQVLGSKRGDLILWLNPNNLLPGPSEASQKAIFKTLEEIKNSLNEKFFLNIKDFECHLTFYPANTHYEKHLDTFQPPVNPGNHPGWFSGTKVRKVSFVIYLNKDWTAADGGELVLFNKQDKEIYSLSPDYGKSIFFLSDEFPHEVLKNNKERLSLTGWMF